MTAANDAPPPRLSIKEQAEYVEALVMRCWSHTDKNFGPAILSLERVDIEVMRELAARLKRMAPHEPDIRRIVVGQ